MRLDIITIFPDYLAPLKLSLLGQAQQRGIVDLRVHNLRDYARDRHRTVDDTPYGGGAGMVMKPEPWGLALEQILVESPPVSTEEERAEGDNGDSQIPLLLVPSPAGAVFNQTMAYELAREEHLIFAPARYEGIDERVFDWAAESLRVLPVSLGDYVLYGGEAAVMVMTEAIVRLLPGAMGNPDSLVEESHTGGLLEYPVYTKPSVWRGREVPKILLSGNHGAIARWRRDRQIERTFIRRYDMISALPADYWNKDDRKLLTSLKDAKQKNNHAE